MDCREISQQLINGTVDEAMRLHANECPACAALIDDNGQLARGLAMTKEEEAPLDIDAMLGNVQRRIGGEVGFRARLRALSTPLRGLFTGLATLLVIVAVLIIRPRSDLGDHPSEIFFIAALLGIGCAIAVVEGLRPLHKPALAHWKAALLLALSLALPVALFLASGTYEATPLDIWPIWRCLTFGVRISALLAAVAWLVGRGFTRSAAFACAVGASLGGVLALQLHCPINSYTHLLFGHASVVGLAVLAVAVVGRLRENE